MSLKNVSNLLAEVEVDPAWDKNAMDDQDDQVYHLICGICSVWIIPTRL